MSFAQIKDNDALIHKIREMILSGAVPHAFIIEAPRSVDKEAFATGFAQALLCKEAPGEGCGVCPVCRRIAEGNHLDVYRVGPTQKKGSKVASVRDEDVESLQERLSSKPLEADRSIAIITEADSVTPRAFNRFLKTLEEPAPGTVILLLSENMQSMPATIRSRCVHLRLNAYGTPADESAKETAETLLHGLIDQLPYYQLREIIEPHGRDRERALLFIDALEGRAGAALAEGVSGMMRDRIYRLISALEDAREEVRRGDRADNALKKMALVVLKTLEDVQ